MVFSKRDVEEVVEKQVEDTKKQKTVNGEEEKKEEPNGDVAAKNEVDSNDKSESDEVQEPTPEAKSDVTPAANAEDASDDDEEGSEGDDEAKKNATDAEMVDAPSAKEAPSESKTLFMGNLSFSIEKSHIVDFFKDTAEVVEVRFAKKNGRLAGYGHVDFASPDAAQKALKLNGELLLDRAVKLDLGKKKDPSNGQTFETANLAPSDSKTLFIGNLSYSVEESHIVDFFKDTAEVVEVRFAKKDGRFAGFGHVDFASPEAVQKALKLNGELLLERAVKLDLAKKRDPSNSNEKKSGESQVSTVFVKGFGTEDGFDSIKSSLEEHFKQCGEISRIFIPKDFESGSPKGVAFIDFTDSSAYSKALALAGSEMSGSTTKNQPYISYTHVYIACAYINQAT
ncbi:polyadenylate-binding protein 2-like [Bidens hawaiensis]|uniref:polyadenylate-binding protein 2-like n=1 Tax=Bidens hawaiensis TaxID=980011 RepID=UPI00404B50E4